MTSWRRFERTRDGVAEHFVIRREGIRCFLGWGSSARRGRAMTVVLDDEESAERHLERKVAERRRRGFVEVPGRAEPAAEADTLLVPALIAMLTKPWFTPQEYRPVDGLRDVVCQAEVVAPGARGYVRYLVLRDGGRSGVEVTVEHAGHDPALAAAFLAVVAEQRDLPFDGTSHHKLALPQPVGPFTHALFCSPALGGPLRAYPALGPRVARAAPIHDCEIGDADPEVVVDARITGRGALRYVDWTRSPQPAIEARGGIDKLRGRARKQFLVYSPTDLARLLKALSGGGPGDWLEIRNFRGEVLRLDPDSAAEVEPFLLGQP